MLLYELPKDYKLLADIRRSQSSDKDFREIFQRYPDHDDGTVNCFIWQHTQEGEKFWLQVFEAVVEKELPELPAYAKDLYLKLEHKV